VIYKKCTLASLMGLVLASGVATAAEDLSYSYIEGDYILQDSDLLEDNDFTDDFLDDTDDGDGYGVRGSFAVSEYLFLFGKYSSTESEFTFRDDSGTVYPQDEDVKTLKLGLGWHMPLTDAMDLVVTGAYTDIDYGDFNLGANENDDLNSRDDLENALDDLNDDSSDGFVVDAGVRAQALTWLEAGGGVRYVDVDSGDNTSVFGNLLFEMTQNFGINAEVDIGDNVNTYELGLRYSF